MKAHVTRKLAKIDILNTAHLAARSGQFLSDPRPAPLHYINSKPIKSKPEEPSQKDDIVEKKKSFDKAEAFRALLSSAFCPDDDHCVARKASA